MNKRIILRQIELQRIFEPYFQDKFGDESKFQVPSYEKLNETFTTDLVKFSN